MRRFIFIVLFTCAPGCFAPWVAEENLVEVTDAAQAPDASAPYTDIPDAGIRDAWTWDAGTLDARAPDAGPRDAGVRDAEAPDADMPDSSAPDVVAPDAGVTDAGIADAGIPRCERDGWNLLVNGDFSLDPLACGWMIRQPYGQHGDLVWWCEGTSCRAILMPGEVTEPDAFQLFTLAQLIGGDRYTLRFRVQNLSLVPKSLLVSVHHAWSTEDLGLRETVPVPPGGWSAYELTFTQLRDETDTSITFAYGGPDATPISLDEVSLTVAIP